MRQLTLYLGWGILGAILGGWVSAAIADATILMPAGRWLAGTSGRGMALLADRSHALVLAGMLMGAASGFCWARWLSLRPVRKVHPAILAVTAVLGVLILPGLQIFSGSVAGLHISSHGVTITTMEVLPPDQQPTVTVGRAMCQCGTTGGRITMSYCDGARVVTVCCTYRRFPWR